MITNWLHFWCHGDYGIWCLTVATAVTWRQTSQMSIVPVVAFRVAIESRPTGNAGREPWSQLSWQPLSLLRLFTADNLSEFTKRCLVCTSDKTVTGCHRGIHYARSHARTTRSSPTTAGEHFELSHCCHRSPRITAPSMVGSGFSQCTAKYV